jgi:hypothetical protein
MTTHLIIPDQHAHPDYGNERADWVGMLIKDLKPDVVVNMGDAADMASLSTYDKGKASFAARNYEKDIEAHLDFQDRLWYPLRKAKKKQPYRIVLEGNHEHRIKRAVDLSPELAGDRFGLSFKDLQWDKYYNKVVEYEGQTPGIAYCDGVAYAHYFVSGLMGRPIGGVHSAASLIAKNMTSCVASHSHIADFSIRTKPDGSHIMGLVAGVYQDYDSPWAGAVNNMWWRGVVMLNSVENGTFEPNFIGINRLKEAYG